MSLTQSQWAELNSLQSAELKDRLFSVIQQLSFDIQERESDDPDTLAAVPRLVSLLDQKPDLSGFREAVSALARSTGLWNYIDKENSDPRDRFVAEAVTVDELDGITLHREQVAALNTLLSGKNLILSAPTSFGKSVLIDALVASGKYNRVAIVLPTIALLDEFRRRLTRRFAHKFHIVMYNSDSVTEAPVIFLGTQERLINRGDIGHLDLPIVDEFYKLDPSRRDERSLTLNAAVYQLLRRASQFFFLGPNIQNVHVSADSRWRFEFLRTRFSTVAVDTFDLRGVTDKQERLEEELARPDNWPALVFVSAPDRANRLATELASSSKLNHSGRSQGAIDFSEWIDTNFGKGWDLSANVLAGIGIHHGRIPRALASHFIRFFNSGELPILLCTSTLIEGVNTAAKSVLIYDKTINREDYDFFTFSNIKGRAGRLGRHHVGSVYVFHAPPDHQEVDVQPPLFGDLDEAPDELVVHISDEDATPRVMERQSEMRERLGITPAELRIVIAIGLEDALALKLGTARGSRNGEPLHWSGFPRYPEILATCEVICAVRRPSEFGVFSAKQLAYFLNQLRIRRPIVDFFHLYTERFLGDSTGQDNIFKFLRACEYGLPQLFGTVEIFAKQLVPATNYELFLAELPRWFRPEVLKNLDEQGVPVQISERFYQSGDTLESIVNRLTYAATDADAILSGFERNWISNAFPPTQGEAVD